MFIVQRNNNKFMCSQLIYSYNQDSFFCNPRFMQQYSLLINDLELGLNEDFELVSVSGLSPYSSWSKKKISIPQSIQGILRYVDESLNIGMSYRIAEFPAYIDDEKGLVLIGDFVSAQSVIQVLDGVMVSLSYGMINGILLKPIFL